MSTPPERFTVAHPAVDGVSTTLIQHETRAEVVHLSEARSDLLRRASAAGQRVALVTDERSQLTYPMNDALLGTGGIWIVREPAGTLRDGSTGRRLDSIAMSVHTSPVRDARDLSPIFLRQAPEPDAPGTEFVTKRLAATNGRQLLVSISVRHNARRTTTLGRTADIIAERLTGRPIHGWGAREPAMVPWDRSALTAYARSRAPHDTPLVIVGTGLVGTILVRRTSHGLEETTQVVVHAGPSGSDQARSVVEQCSPLFEEVSLTQTPLFGLVTTRTGRADLLIPSVIEAPVVPLAMLLGLLAIREVSLDLDHFAHEFGAHAVGRRRTPGVVVPLGTFDHADWGRLTTVITLLGADRVLTAVSGQATQTALRQAYEEVKRAQGQ